MAKTKAPSGPWRIDPQRRSQVIDQFGRNMASVEPEIDASLIATAPDMFALLEKLEKDDNSIPQRCGKKSYLFSAKRAEILAWQSFPVAYPGRTLRTKSG